MNPAYPIVAARAQHKCEYCCAPEIIFNFPFDVEHIIPVYYGGEDVESNLALACRSCNLFKGVKFQSLDPETGLEVRLFHPRQDKWSNHFKVNLETNEIIGRTSIGRATVFCLNMNSPAQLLGREAWSRYELFP